MSQLKRTTPDLSAYPDLVVIYLGMRVLNLRGLRTLRRVGKEIRRAVEAAPDGLLRHENLTFSTFPLHAGMRQYWRDLDALERWTRSGIHREWWSTYLRDPAGTAFWHETYFIGGGMEAIFVDVPGPLGMLAFAPELAARGPMFSARSRARRSGAVAVEEMPAPVIAEDDLERV
jgi:hypothetical protein